MPNFHGIRVNEPITGVMPLVEKSTAVIGLIATASAPGAEAAELDAAFPLNKPVLVTDVRAAIGRAGDDGTLAKALRAIATQGSPVVVVIRIAEGADADTTAANAIGSSVAGVYTGMQALLAAPARLGVRPRILGAPGLDTQAVATALAAVARELRGMVYAAARPGATLAADVAAANDYRGEFGDRELMLIWPDFTGWDGHAVAVALGTRAMLDTRIGWHKSLSNIAVAGVEGISKDVSFDIRSSANDAAVLNENQVTTLVRMDGYRFWGNRTCANDLIFTFEVAVRTSQVIQDAIADANASVIDKPMTVGLVRDIVEMTNARLARWVTQGRLIGGECWYDPEQNAPSALAAGQLAVDYDFTAVAPLEGLTQNQRITDRYYLSFADRVNA